jgi:hypothetical protein
LLLRKFDPAMVTLCPAEPLEGLREEITGGPLGASAAVEDVVVELEVEAEGGFVAEGGEAVGLAINETSSATAAATTRAPAAATERISQRLGPAAGGLPAGAEGGLGVVPPGWVTGIETGEPAGPCPRNVGAVGGGGRGGIGAIPADSRARRTALSIAPRAR